MPEPTQQKPTGGAPFKGGFRGRSPFPPRAGGSGKPGERSGGRRDSFERPKPEFDQKMLSIRRVTRVVSGGRRMTFSVALAIGDKKGSLGLGTGKAGDTSLAIAKAQKSAKKNMIKIKMTKTGSIAHEIRAKFGASEVFLMPNRGRGLVAGSAVRDLLVLAGIKDITSKILSGSKNKLNNARATMDALRMVSVPRALPKEEEKKVEAAA